MKPLVDLALLALLAASAPTDGLVKYLPYREAAQQSIAQQKPLLIYFTDPHCGPCRALEAQVFANPQAAVTVNTGFLPVKVVMNGPKPVPSDTPRLIKRFGVQGAPSVIIVSPSGSELRRFAWLGRAEVVGILNRYAVTQGAAQKAP